MGMSTHGHQQLSEHHAGHAGSHADAKVRYTMLAVLLVVAELLTANPRSPDHETWLLRSAIAARRNRQRVDEAASDHCGREVFPENWLHGGYPNPVQYRGRGQLYTATAYWKLKKPKNHNDNKP